MVHGRTTCEKLSTIGSVKTVRMLCNDSSTVFIESVPWSSVSFLYFV